ncbi:MAG: cohesin domain-containing protein [Candidatus Dojkabacteria bacterium]
MSKKEKTTKMELFQKFIRRIRTPFLLTLIIFFLLTSEGSAQAIARAGLLEDIQVRPGVAVEIPIDIEDVVDLYGIEIELEFDPTFWEFEDADPRREGIQPAIGTFLDPGMTLFSIIDMEEGRIHLVMSQVNPSEAKSGDGNILVLYASALKTGVTSFEVTKVELSTRDGIGIEVEGVDGEVTIENEAPLVTATSIPVVDPTQIIIIPTYSPPTATATSRATSTPRPANTSQPTAMNTNVPTATATSALSETAAIASTATPAEGVGQVKPSDIPPAAQTEAEESGTQGRVLGKDSPGQLPWVIAGGAVLVIIAGVVVYTRRKKVEQPEQSDH